MKLRSLLVLLLALGAAATAFHLVQRQVSDAWFAFGVHPDVVAVVQRSLADQKLLAELDPDDEPAYRERFDEIHTLLTRLRVLEHSRGEIVRRYELALLAVAAGMVLLSGAGYAWRQSRQETRLGRLQEGLGELAAGHTDVVVGERRRDLIGRIAAMVEQTSRRMARDRRRLASLEHLSAWQEAARRHAHEMRAPLTAAHLELERLAEASQPAEKARLLASLGQELERLADFTRRFTTFARIPRPSPAPHDLGRLVGELATLFAGAWPELTVGFSPPPRPVWALVDPEMLRQVLVNLGDNSALALREKGARGRSRLSVAEAGEMAVVEVADDGPGVPSELRHRLFEPYSTSRRVGEGMGLGLAICRKILLDHGGDLELVATSASGTTFRMLFPRAASPAGEEAAS